MLRHQAVQTVLHGLRIVTRENDIIGIIEIYNSPIRKKSRTTIESMRSILKDTLDCQFE